mgnify:FL=1
MYEYKARVGFSNVGPDHKLKMYALMNILQDATCFHSDSIGYGVEYLAPQGMGWFVTNYEVHVKRMPYYGQEVTVRTYAISFRGMLGNRCFEVLDDTGEVIAYAASMWVLMDLKRLAPVRVPQEMIEAYQVDPALPYHFSNKKIRPVEGSKIVGSFVVDKMYIDTNSHMNNSIYIDVTSRFLPEGFYPGSIMINYKKAAQLDDELQIKVAVMEDGYQVLLTKDDEIYTIVEFTI